MKSKIPKGIYCYDDNGNCPYRNEISHMKINYTGYYYDSVIECKYLNINTAQLWLNQESNTKYSAWCLYDSCKLCNVNKWE